MLKFKKKLTCMQILNHTSFRAHIMDWAPTNTVCMSKSDTTGRHKDRGFPETAQCTQVSLEFYYGHHKSSVSE